MDCEMMHCEHTILKLWIVSNVNVLPHVVPSLSQRLIKMLDLTLLLVYMKNKLLHITLTIVVI